MTDEQREAIIRSLMDVLAPQAEQMVRAALCTAEANFIAQMEDLKKRDKLLWDIYHKAFHMMDDAQVDEMRPGVELLDRVAFVTMDQFDELSNAMDTFEEAYPNEAHGERGREESVDG